MKGATASNASLELIATVPEHVSRWLQTQRVIHSKIRPDNMFDTQIAC